MILPKSSSFASLYTLLSIMFALIILLNLIADKTYRDISSKKDFIDSKEKEVVELKKLLRKMDINYTPRNIDSIKADMFKLVERLSKNFSVNIKGDFNVIEGKIITLKIEVTKNNPSSEELESFFECLEYPGLLVTIEQLTLEKGETESKLEAIIEARQVFK